MSIFDVLTLFGGLAMFLYGMRLMGDSLKEGSSGTLRSIMEKVTNNPVKAFLLGLFVTAVIQSSTATIVITAGLVAAGVISLHQSLGIILGANVGTTITGQIIRLMDLNDTSVAWLQLFKASTLAPVALILGIILIMFVKAQNSDLIGRIAMGFGILFMGLMTMTDAVSVLSDSGAFDSVFSNLGSNPVLGYLAGAAVAFVLQSSSATVGILQAISISGFLTFKGVFGMLLGIYLGDCVTTAIVIWIGAKSGPKRVATFNLIYNAAKSVLVLAVVLVVYRLGMLSGIWLTPMNSGDIANANTVFNLACAIVLLPCCNIFERWTCKIIKSDETEVEKYTSYFEGMNAAFFQSPAIAFKSCYDTLLLMFDLAQENIEKAFGLFEKYDAKAIDEINEAEEYIDRFADRMSNYLIELSPYLNEETYIHTMDQYYKTISEFERLGDHAVNLMEAASDLQKNKSAFSEEAMKELAVMQSAIFEIMELTRRSFVNTDANEARHIEPLEEVVDDLVYTMRNHHLMRMRKGICDVYVDSDWLNMLNDIERISDVCSNVGIAIVANVEPSLASAPHDYISALHRGENEMFNREYEAAHAKYFGEL